MRRTAGPARRDLGRGALRARPMRQRRTTPVTRAADIAPALAVTHFLVRFSLSERISPY